LGVKPCFVFKHLEKFIKKKCNTIGMLGLFGHKKKVEKLRTDIQDSFSHVKKDFNKVGEWIRHLDDKNTIHKDEMIRIQDQILGIQNDLIEIKEFISFFGPQLSKDVSKQIQINTNKQTNTNNVQTGSQTGSQTDILSKLTVMERGIVWALLNSDMKLSYEDLAALLGKNKSTIRGQINSIKQKSNVIKESREFNGKKRLYIPKEIRSEVMKNVKIKMKNIKK